MRILYVFLFIFPLSAFADSLGLSGCGLYEFQGTPRIQNGKVVLILNEKSLSEIILRPAIIDEAKLAPHVNLMTQGQLVIQKITGPQSADIKEFTKLTYGESDPLKLTGNTFLKKKKDLKCP